MRRTLLAWSALLVILACGADLAVLALEGKVYEDANGNGAFDNTEQALAGVTLSDGQIVTLTAEDGSYTLETRAGATVFVSVPGSHHAPHNQFYVNIDCASGQQAADFPLKKNERAGGGKFTFAFVSDTHVGFLRQAREGTAKAFAAVMALQPDLVIHGGDIILDALNTDQELAQKQYELYVNELAPLITPPFYHTIGNHDVFGWFSLPKPKPIPPLYGKQIYRKYFGPRYYSFNHDQCHFVVLDSIARGKLPGGEVSYYGFIDRPQLEWLRKDLKQIDVSQPVILVTHIPTINALGSVFGTKGEVAVTPAGETVPKHQVSNVPELFGETLKGYNLKLALAGHYHTYEQIRWKTNTQDAVFVVGGSICGEWWKGDRTIGYVSWPEAFTLIKVDGEQFDVSFVPYGWKGELER